MEAVLIYLPPEIYLSLVQAALIYLPPEIYLSLVQAAPCIVMRVLFALDLRIFSFSTWTEKNTIIFQNQIISIDLYRHRLYKHKWRPLFVPLLESRLVFENPSNISWRVFIIPCWLNLQGILWKFPPVGARWDSLDANYWIPCIFGGRYSVYFCETIKTTLKLLKYDNYKVKLSLLT